MLNRRIEADRKAPAQIKVIGVGGGGCNSVRRMLHHERVPGVEYIAVNTDIKSLDSLSGEAISVQIGEHLTHGFGAGGDARVGAKAAEEGQIVLKRAVKDAELVFITVGMGGGTGTGAAPVVAQMAKESGALVIAVVTTPFAFEGKKRLDVALSGISRLKAAVDNIIVVHNDRLLQLVNHDTSVGNAFAMADEVVSEGILSVSQLVNVPGEINVDLADVKVVLGIPGTALMAIGQAQSNHAAMDAVEQAISNPLLDVSMKGARGILLNFLGGSDLRIGEVNEAATLVARQADPKATIFFGMSAPNEELVGKAKVTLIATGIKMPVSNGWFAGVKETVGTTIGGRRGK